VPESGRSRPAQLFALALAAVLVSAASVRASPTASVGAAVDISPLVVTIELGSTTVAAGRQVGVRATVRNLGDAVVGPIGVELRFEPAGLEVRGPATARIARLAPGRGATVSWQVRGLKPGAYVLLARATVGPFATESRAVVLTVLPPRR
jgi:uncharacterized membrane protein